MKAFAADGVTRSAAVVIIELIATYPHLPSFGSTLMA